MATINMTPPEGITTQMAGVGDGQSHKKAIRQFTLTAALGAGDILVGPRVQRGAIITDAYVVGNSGGTVGTPTKPNFGTRPFAPYVLTKNENVQLTAGAGGTANDVVFLVVEYLPRNT